ncbi:hypothetical protein HU200_018386 [Digitaria exilis]|uniref:LOB domain-containing protein n=1 Tax=Digitaria exilis TaxID=1010633 RepID=A0A835F467_9POAL|nr:hypothetical protein HU200_018386 [Digitaria exilis]
MSCNGCRVLRKGCSEACVLRPCLQWIDTADAPGPRHRLRRQVLRPRRPPLLQSPPSPTPSALRCSSRCCTRRRGGPSTRCTARLGCWGRGTGTSARRPVDTVLRGGAIGPLPDLGGGCGAGTGSGDLYGPAGAGVGGKRAGGWSLLHGEARRP